jgi:hypothetical protein
MDAQREIFNRAIEEYETGAEREAQTTPRSLLVTAGIAE